MIRNVMRISSGLCRRVSTPLFDTMEILGRDECLARLDAAIAKAAALA